MSKRRKNRTAARRGKLRIGTPESSMQMPYGLGSVFDAVECGILNAMEGMTLALHHFWSNWDKDITHARSHNNVAAALDISYNYVRQLRKRLVNWLEKVSVTARGTIFKVTTHFLMHIDPSRLYTEDLPIDEHGNPLKFWVPVKNGGPFHELLQGNISWRACWMWLVLRLYSIRDRTAYNYGHTFAMNYKTLSEKTGMSKDKVCSAVKELIDIGLIERLSLPHERSRFKLKGILPSRRPRSEYDKDFRRDKDHWYSLNEKYRVIIETGEMQVKNPKNRKWISVDYAKVPKNIAIDLERLGDMSRDLSARFDGLNPLERLGMKADEHFKAITEKQHQEAFQASETNVSYETHNAQKQALIDAIQSPESTGYKGSRGGCNSGTCGCNGDPIICNSDTLPF